jgi:hypothetical protein
MDKKIRKMIITLEKQGYIIREKPNMNRPKVFIKKTFEVEKETLHSFLDVAYYRDLKIKEALEEALQDWIERNG